MSFRQLFAVRICRGYLPWEFAAAICRGNLPREFAVAICRENLPWPFAVAICRGNLPWEFAVVFSCVCKQTFFLCEQFLFLCKQTFFIRKQNIFLFMTVFLLTVYLFAIAVAVMGHRNDEILWRKKIQENLVEFKRCVSAEFNDNPILQLYVKYRLSSIFNTIHLCQIFSHFAYCKRFCDSEIECCRMCSRI